MIHTPPASPRSSNASFFFMVVTAAIMAAGTAMAQSPPVIDTVTPNSVIEKPVPQPTITITGSNLVVGLPSPTNRPTVTISHTAMPKVSFSTLANVNFSGTQVTIPPGLNQFNLLQAPLGNYNLTITRPDGASVVLPGAFSINTQPEPAPGEIEMRIASYWGGPILGMDLSSDGSLAYIANGRVLRILDISDESNPTSIGSIYLNGVYDVKVRDGYAFVAAQGPYSFCVVDVSDPTSPELVWSADSGTTRRQVELYGDYAYVRPGGVFDISDPLNIVSAGAVALGDTFVIDGDRLVTNQGIYDLAANPINPPLVSSFSGIDSDGSYIAAHGDHVYIAAPTAAGTLRTIDISNLAAPVIVNEIDDTHHLSGLSILNGHLLVADSINGAGNEPSSAMGLAVYDITSDPGSPSLVTAYKPMPNANPRGVHSAGSRAYAFDDSEGLVILDMSTPTTPLRLGTYHSPSNLKRMAKFGEHLFVADWYGGFTVLDVADAGHPVVISSYQADTWDDIGVAIEDLQVHDGLAYISLRYRGLDVVDVSDPANPTLIGNFFPPPPNFMNKSYFAGIAVADSVAHIGFYDRINASAAAHRYLTVNVSNPAQMFEIARSEHIPAHNPANAIVLHDLGAAFTAHGSGGARIIDVSNTANPVNVDGYANAKDLDLALTGDTLFAAAGTVNFNNPGLHIFDVSEPFSPKQIAYLNSAVAYAVDVQNGRAYVVGLGTGMKLLDVSDPTAPVEIGALGGSIGNPFENSILVDEPQAYITSISHTGSNSPTVAGLVIIDVHGVEPQGPLGDLNNDGIVDVSDLLILLSNWGGCPRSGDCIADLNEDGAVDVADLLILLGNWG